MENTLDLKLTDYLVRFKVIDHESDECSPLEETIIPASDMKNALDIFYNDMIGVTVILDYITEVNYWRK